MSRKHFERIAATIKSTLELVDADPASVDGVKILAARLATDFEAFNPNFDRVRFLKAAGVHA